MRAPVCKSCGKAEWNHLCGGGEKSAEPKIVPVIQTEGPRQDKFDRARYHRDYQKRYMRERRAHETYSVYLLIDPRDDLPFYVGCSFDPKKRAGEHRTDPGAGGYKRVREIHGMGLKCISRTVVRFGDRQTALAFERALMFTIEDILPNRLVNRHELKTRRAKEKEE